MPKAINIPRPFEAKTVAPQAPWKSLRVSKNYRVQNQGSYSQLIVRALAISDKAYGGNMA